MATTQAQAMAATQVQAMAVAQAQAMAVAAGQSRTAATPGALSMTRQGAVWTTAPSLRRLEMLSSLAAKLVHTGMSTWRCSMCSLFSLEVLAR